MVMNLAVEQFRDIRPFVKEILCNGLKGSDLSFTIKLSDLGLRINKETRGKLSEVICNAVYDVYVLEV